MKKLIVVIIILLLASIIVFAELNDEAKSDIEKLKEKHCEETRESIEMLVEKLKDKYYLACVSDDVSFPPGISINFPDIKVVDISLNVLMQVKGWEIWINDKCYYVLLVEKED